MTKRQWLMSLSDTYLAKAISKGACSMCIYGEYDELEDDYHCSTDWNEFEDLCQEGIYFWLRRDDND
jgi:hypothetical protein